MAHMMRLYNIKTGGSTPYSKKLYNKNKKSLNKDGYYSEKDAEAIRNKEIEVVVIANSHGYQSLCSKKLFDSEIEFEGKKMKHSEKLTLLGYVVVEVGDDLPEEETTEEITEEATTEAKADVSQK